MNELMEMNPFSKLKDKFHKSKLCRRDLPAILIFAFVFLQLSNFIFFAKPVNSFSPAAVPAESLSQQILLFLLALILSIYIRIYHSKVPLWLLTVPQIAFYALILSINSQNICLNFTLNLLCLVLLFSLKNYRSFKGIALTTNIFLPFAVFLFSLGKGIYLFSKLDIEDTKNFFTKASLKSGFLLFVFLLTILLCLLYYGYSHHLGKKYKDINLLRSREEQRSRVIAYAVFIFGFSLGVLLMARATIYRVLDFAAPTFDHGLFRQMFEYMRRTGQPLTTLERDGLYSHFNVHFSPIFYLLLPIYALFPYSITLNLTQIIIVASASIPIFLLSRHFEIKKPHALFFSGLYLLQTAIILGSYYDIHESCFYAPLVVWWFYSIFKHNLRLNFLISILLLMVKEDAALFLISAAIFLFFSAYFEDKKYRLYALTLIALAGFAFFLIAGYLNSKGDGLMSYRFAALQQYDGKGITGIIRSLFQNFPGFLGVVFSQEKLPYVLASWAGTGFVSLFQKDKSNYILFIPLLVMNLATDYQYQYNYFFQYSYASQSFVFIAFLLAYKSLIKEESEMSNLTLEDSAKEIRERKLNKSLLIILLVFACTFSFTLSLKEIAKLEDSVVDYRENSEKYKAIQQTLARLPRDKVTCTQTFLSTNLADIEELYDIKNNSSVMKGRSIEMLVLPKSYVQDSANEGAIKYLRLVNNLEFSFEYSSEWIFVWLKSPE